MPQEAIIDFIESRSQVRTPNQFEGRLGSKIGLDSLLGSESKSGYAGYSATKVTAPNIHPFRSPKAIARKNVKSSHQLRRIQQFLTQTNKEEEHEK